MKYIAAVPTSVLRHGTGYSQPEEREENDQKIRIRNTTVIFILVLTSRIGEDRTADSLMA